MKTLIIYFDETKKNFQKCTPFGQDKNASSQFDGDWMKLVQQLTNGYYYKFEVI